MSKLSDNYNLDAEARSSLADSVAQSKHNLKLDLEDATAESRNLAFAFAKRFHSLPADDWTLREGARAVTYPDQHHISMEESVDNEACYGIGRDRMTVSHEI